MHTRQAAHPIRDLLQRLPRSAPVQAVPARPLPWWLQVGDLQACAPAIQQELLRRARRVVQRSARANALLFLWLALMLATLLLTPGLDAQSRCILAFTAGPAGMSVIQWVLVRRALRQALAQRRSAVSGDNRPR